MISKHPLYGTYSAHIRYTALHHMYTRVSVCFVRRALSSQQLTLASVMVVDTPGLRSPRHSAEERGASWSELCHNYLQERLLERYHTHTFTHTLERYTQVRKKSPGRIYNSHLLEILVLHHLVVPCLQVLQNLSKGTMT